MWSCCLLIYGTSKLHDIRLLSEHPKNFLKVLCEGSQKALQCTQEPLRGHPAMWVGACPTTHETQIMYEGVK